MIKYFLPLMLFAIPSPALANSVTCEYSAYDTYCRGYDSNIGNYTAEETYTGEYRIKADNGNVYTCGEYTGCRGGY